MSYFWLFDEVKKLLGCLGMCLVRIDQCTVGTPFQKPQLWLTSCTELMADGAVCYHPLPHPEKLAGSRTRMSAPYPAPLCDIIAHAFDRQLNMIGRVNDTLRKNASFLLAHLFGSVEGRPSEDSVFIQELRACGTRMVKECRHGTAAFSAEQASLEMVDSLDSPARIARSASPSEPEKAFGSPSSKNRFDRDHVIALQEADADFSDIILALKTQRELKNQPKGSHSIEDSVSAEAVVDDGVRVPDGGSKLKLYKKLRMRSVCRKERSMNGTRFRCRLLLLRDRNPTKPDTVAALSAWVPEPLWRGVTTTSGSAIPLRCSSISDDQSIPKEHASHPLLLASTPSRPKFLGDDLFFMVTSSNWT